MDHAAALVFGDFGVGEASLCGEGLARQPGPAGQGPAKRDGEPAPQLAGVGIEQDGAGVVVGTPLVVPLRASGGRAEAGQARW